MTFTEKVKGNELQYMMQLLEIFGIVETTQMRALFSFLNDAEYKRLTTFLQLQDAVYCSPDTNYIAINQLALEQEGVSERANCFRAFLYLKDKADDFCAGTAPAIITLFSATRSYDLIPLSKKTIDKINVPLAEVDVRTVRVFVTTEPMLVRNLCCTAKTEFVIDVTDASAPRIYEL